MKPEIIEKLDKMVEKELHKIVEKGDITPLEVENATKAVCLLEKIRMYMDYMDEDEGYSQMISPRIIPRNSYERGRNMRTGRYVSRDSNGSYTGYGMNGGNSNEYVMRGTGNYSRHGADDMVETLEMMRDNAASEQEKRMIDQWIENAMTV